MTKQQLIIELTKLVSQLIHREELWTTKASCKLMELIQFVENPDDKELNRIHASATLQLIMVELTRMASKGAQESTLAE